MATSGEIDALQVGGFFPRLLLPPGHCSAILGAHWPVTRIRGWMMPGPGAT
ncbi:hypothetical protein THTE_1373 [Thermogutta terrifontis]|uniref:Uncharacterized protein n=1 Tax=Thermogutta terrifontis TaxID=1331910 RepID=A0A286RDD1_9BACT|nr:hypothetical protein THTE_1373 [Thermogutta terrifontis]